MTTPTPPDLQLLTIVVFTLAFLVERLVDRIKAELPPGVPPRVVPLLALALGLVLAFGIRLDLIGALLARADLTIVPLIGQLLTGLLISGGSNWLHHLLDAVRSFGVVVITPAPVDPEPPRS